MAKLKWALPDEDVPEEKPDKSKGDKLKKALGKGLGKVEFTKEPFGENFAIPLADLKAATKDKPWPKVPIQASLPVEGGDTAALFEMISRMASGVSPENYEAVTRMRKRFEQLGRHDHNGRLSPYLEERLKQLLKDAPKKGNHFRPHVRGLRAGSLCLLRYLPLPGLVPHPAQQLQESQGSSGWVLAYSGKDIFNKDMLIQAYWHPQHLFKVYANDSGEIYTAAEVMAGLLSDPVAGASIAGGIFMDAAERVQQIHDHYGELFSQIDDLRSRFADALEIVLQEWPNPGVEAEAKSCVDTLQVSYHGNLRWYGDQIGKGPTATTYIGSWNVYGDVAEHIHASVSGTRFWFGEEELTYEDTAEKALQEGVDTSKYGFVLTAAYGAGICALPPDIGLREAYDRRDK